MHIVGLTGRIGTGKSTVARWLSEHGVAVLETTVAFVKLSYQSVRIENHGAVLGQPARDRRLAGANPSGQADDAHERL